MATSYLSMFIAVFLLVIPSALSSPRTSSHGYAVTPKPKLLVVLLDGLRWDHFGLDLEHLNKIAQSGVKAEWMEPVFITMSLPSMISIATGLYPESHGVVHNLYYDPDTKNQTNTYQETLNVTEWFDAGAEPIWVTALKNGLKVSSIFYPGTYVPIKGYKPDISVPITRWHYFNYPKEKRIDDTISWLTEKDYDMSLLYFADPDVPLHLFGIGNENSTYLTLALDHYMGYLFQQIQEKQLQETLNVIIVSDHGHANVNQTNIIELYDYINESDVDFVIGNYGPTFQLRPKEGKFEKVYNALKDTHPNLHVYKKEEIPERFHYGKHSRVLPIFGYVDPTWEVFTRYDPAKTYKSDHGYDNEAVDMRGIFYGHGPFFKQGHRAKPLKSIDLYEMMCEILNVEPAPNNGSRCRYEDMKRPAEEGVPCATCVSSRTFVNLTVLVGAFLFALFADGSFRTQFPRW
ncbi:ectonucleotide pyrophosphatase/phosphodiesterase family member 7-like [Apostichopus japonicus]|uniref:ectonucleotide pyrophosphatase/phosphodiesterase family member 7-like n=1 Tax=Stichopus japonicus TaxID=307972 RepID=UPI003AB2D2FB